MRTFAELFCQRYHVAPHRFERAVFWLCLHRRALLLAPWILWVNRGFFAADFEFIAHLASLKSARGIYDAIDDFQLHPANASFAHRHLKIRLSIERVIRLVHRVLPRT